MQHATACTAQQPSILFRIRGVHSAAMDVMQGETSMHWTRTACQMRQRCSVALRWPKASWRRTRTGMKARCRRLLLSTCGASMPSRRRLVDAGLLLWLLACCPDVAENFLDVLAATRMVPADDLPPCATGIQICLQGESVAIVLHLVGAKPIREGTGRYVSNPVPKPVPCACIYCWCDNRQTH